MPACANPWKALRTFFLSSTGIRGLGIPMENHSRRALIISEDAGTAQTAHCPKMKVAEGFRLASLSGSCWRPVWLCYTSNQRGEKAGQGVRPNILSAGDMPDVRGVFIQVTQLPRLS